MGTHFGFQALIYGNGHDPVLKQALKNRKTAEETLNYGGLEEMVKDCFNARAIGLWYSCQDINQQLESEKKASGQVELPGTAPAPSGEGAMDEVPEHILTSSLEEGLESNFAMMNELLRSLTTRTRSPSTALWLCTW